ncbi:MAG: acyltransferase family protein, partial [Blastocatellia bacterium]
MFQHKKHKDDFVADLQSKLALRHIPALDGIRAIAVFLVIFYHTGFEYAPGAQGVTIFFVLSGFLITWLLLGENERLGDISLKGFYRRRILRIFPAFYAYWLGVILLLVVTNKFILWPHAISSFFYVSNYYNAILGDPNTAFSHTWSLAIEEQFYLLWPLAFWGLRRDLKKMTTFLVCLIGAVWIHRAILLLAFKVDQAYFYAAFDTRIDHLMVGCLAAVLLKRGALYSFWKAICSSLYAPLIVLALYVGSIRLNQSLPHWYRDGVGSAVEPLLIAMLMVQLISLSSTSAVKWIESPPMRYLGRISYSLYLFHPLTVSPVMSRLSDKPLMAQSAAIALTVIVATISYYVVERPFLKLRNARRIGTASGSER